MQRRWSVEARSAAWSWDRRIDQAEPGLDALKALIDAHLGGLVVGQDLTAESLIALLRAIRDMPLAQQVPAEAPTRRRKT